MKRTRRNSNSDEYNNPRPEQPTDKFIGASKGHKKSMSFGQGQVPRPLKNERTYSEQDDGVCESNASEINGKTYDGPMLDEETAKNIYNKLLNDKNKRNPTVKKNWGSDEIKLLEYAVHTYLQKKKHGEDKLTTHDWKEIANFIPGRTESQCLYKWNLTKHKVSFRKSTWQAAEDNILKELVHVHGKKHWQKIANELNERMGNNSNRAGKQCRERWLNHLDDKIRKDPWGADEDLTLLTKQKIIGNKWSDIVKYLPGRTENMVKNRFNTLAKQKREEKRNNCVQELDEVIDNLEEEKGHKDDKNGWIDEKIIELQAQLGKERSDNRHSVKNNQRQGGMNLEDKRRQKYEEKKGIYENSKHKYDDEDVTRNSFSVNQKESYPNPRGMSSNYANKPSNTQKEENPLMYDSTPQYLNRRAPFEGPLSNFASPYDFPNRQLPPNANRAHLNSFALNKQLSSPSPMKFNESGNRFVEPASKFDSNMLSPVMPSSASNFLKQSLNSPCCISARSSIIKLLKACREGKTEAEQLKAVKQLLTEFRDFGNAQKDKVLSLIDNMIVQKDFDDGPLNVSCYPMPLHRRFKFLKVA